VGSRLDFTTDCASTTPSPIPPSLSFTASGEWVRFSLVNGADAFVTTYALTPCRFHEEAAQVKK
jgi:hypothetical protein